MDSVRRLLVTLPPEARRCHGHGCGIKGDCLRYRMRDHAPAAPVLGMVCKDPGRREFFLLAPAAPQPQQPTTTT